MECPGGHSLTIDAGFSGKKRTSMYISREKGDRYYIQRRHNDLFFSLHFFLGKLKEKLARKARVNMRSCSCPPGHPTILLKSNWFNMAAVPVKGSMTALPRKSHQLRRLLFTCLVFLVFLPSILMLALFLQSSARHVLLVCPWLALIEQD